MRASASLTRPPSSCSERAGEFGPNLSTDDAAAHVVLAERLDAVLVTAATRLPRAPSVACEIYAF